MSNSFGTDLLIQAPDPAAAAAFYTKVLGFQVTHREADLISVHGDHINLFIERGPALGPVLEVTVPDLAEARRQLIHAGGQVIKDEPEVPRCYIKDPYGLLYNLTV